MRCGVALALFAVIVACWSEPARAFSDPTLFAKLPLAAGGGGRFFTGSPADGYTCKVCHDGGPEPHLIVDGLPSQGYRPNARYEIEIAWPASVEKLALAVELTDELGHRAGSLRLPPDAEVQPQEYCDPPELMLIAGMLSDTSDMRQIINVPDCGSKHLRFLWTAPASDVGRVWFSGSAVASDGQADSAHDGVTDFGRVLASPRSPSSASVASGQCGVSFGRAQQAWWSLAALLAGLAALRAARRVRRRS